MIISANNLHTEVPTKPYNKAIQKQTGEYFLKVKIVFKASTVFFPMHNAVLWAKEENKAKEVIQNTQDQI